MNPRPWVCTTRCAALASASLILSTGCADVLGIETLTVAEAGSPFDSEPGPEAEEEEAEAATEATQEAETDTSLGEEADTRTPDVQQQDASEAETAAPVCPPDVPAHSETCLGVEQCIFDECRKPRSMLFYARCVGQSWQIVRFQCEAVSCGEHVCSAPGEVCVGDESGAQHCRPNPCHSMSMTVNCECAGQLCVGANPICDNSGTAASHVMCVSM